MSIRVYELSKQLNIENKKLIGILQEKGFQVKTASSSIDNISAGSILKEFSGTQGIQENRLPETTGVHPLNTEANIITHEPPPITSDKPSYQKPFTGIIKTAEQVQKEREEKKSLTRPSVVVQEHSISTIKHTAPVIAKPLENKAAALPINTPHAPHNTPSRPHSAGDAPKLPTIPKAPVKVVQQDTASENFSENQTESISASDQGGLRMIQLKPPIVVRDFALLLGLKPFRLISELMEMGIFASMNQTIEENVAIKIAQKHHISLDVRHRGEQHAPAPEVKEKAPQQEVDDSKFLEPRPPVVCILGHVDHGKTSLLDTIRKTSVVQGEAGGITQHIGAYQIEHHGQKITFLDTPGHAAFSKMRERGANITDIAILVVAADDGFMPQTDEALKFAQRAHVALVVAINKIDGKGANIDRVKQQMQQRNITSEDWGGEILCAEISALKNQNIDHLLESILLQAEMLELKANPHCSAEGAIIESQVEIGRGPVATVIIQKGTLHSGDVIVCGQYYCKVRAMFTDSGQAVKSALPSTPIKVIGWSGVPDSGALFKVAKNEKEARRVAAEFEEKLKAKVFSEMAGGEVVKDLDSLMAAIENTKRKVLRVCIKADVHGSVEALKMSLEAIKSSKVDLEVIDAQVGNITKNDISLASSAEAIVVGFNTKIDNDVQGLAKHHNIRILQHNIIYELIDQVKECMVELLEPEIRENKVGAAEVRQVFSMSKESVAGCMVIEGSISRDAFAKVVRNGSILFEGKVNTLKRFKEDVNEVRAGYECGMRINNFDNYKTGDILECFEVKKVFPKL